MSEVNLGSPDLDDGYSLTEEGAFEFHSNITKVPLLKSGKETDTPTVLQDQPVFQEQLKPNNLIESFSVAWEKNISLPASEEATVSFSTCQRRNLLVTISTAKEERWIYEDINPEIIACKIAASIREAGSRMITSPLELIILGIEIGKAAQQQQKS
jgi:hypothetical protein